MKGLPERARLGPGLPQRPSQGLDPLEARAATHLPAWPRDLRQKAIERAIKNGRRLCHQSRHAEGRRIQRVHAGLEEGAPARQRKALGGVRPA